MPFDYGRVQLLADRLIKRVGREGVLRRSSGDRDVTVVMAFFRPQERRDLFQWGDEHAFVSARGLTVPPDQEEDVLVLGTGRSFEAPFVTYRIVAPPGRINPAGTVVFWDLHVRK